MPPEEARRGRWTALWAAMLGFMLDAMDVLLYVFAIAPIRAEFNLTNAEAGAVGSATMLASAAGGIIAGVLADRWGRRRVLIYTVLLYSFASAGTALSTGLFSLIGWRMLVGLGLGGEWAAGATLVAETWPAASRGRAIAFMQSGWALGYMLAALISGLILPRLGWRVLFAAGVFPALLTIYIRRSVREPVVWQPRESNQSLLEILRAPLRRTTIIASALAAATQFAYWGLFTWIPGFLSAPRDQNGAGFSIVKTSAWVFLIQAGAFAGYNCFGLLADRLGRKPAFLLYVSAAAALVPAFGFAPAWASESWLPLLAPLLGFFGSGYFSLFGAMLAELFPNAVRCTGQGFTYNLGRGVAAFAPFLVGAVADRSGFGPAIALNSAFYIAAGALILALPETKHVEFHKPIPSKL